MIADKNVMEVVLDKETHDKLKKKTGVSVKNGADLIRAIYILLNQRQDVTDTNVGNKVFQNGKSF